MKVINAALLLSAFLASAVSTCSPASAQRADLYRCDGCEAIYEHGFDDLTWSTRIADKEEPGEPLVLTGTVYETDAKTPAEGVIIYAYQTNAAGVYPTTGDEKGWGRRHGHLRGWIRTGENGRYQFRTIKPGSYPGRSAPAHIHMTVKEPGKTEYWIDDVVFAGDPHLSDDPENQGRHRGGSGVVTLVRDENGVWQAVRDITLERHPQ